jgi:3-hydroxyisobutyrate dehydrogenase-like beta-hydroxyacid dehydrogenase
MDLGFVGLGAMGQGMARVLLRAGHRVVVWNRTRARADALAPDGATVAGTPAEAARCGLVLSMLADDRAVEAVAAGPDGIVAGLPAGGVHVSMSTIGPDTVEALARHHDAQFQHLVAAPVFGRPDAAAAGKLAVVASGPPAAVERARPALEGVGQKLFVVSEAPAAAALVKLAGNFLITTVIEGLAESMTVVAKGGVDAGRFLEVLTGTLFDAPLFKTYGRIILEERYVPAGFALPLGLKDNRLILQAGERLSVPLPLASLVRDRMLAAMARGWADRDWSCFAEIAAADARLAPERQGPVAKAT